MFEKVNPSHPDKIADRIAGALVDRAYVIKDDPKIAVEVLIGHNQCTIISEANVRFTDDEVKNIIKRISGQDVKLLLIQNNQDIHLADNQKTLSCGDNGIFKGAVVSEEEKYLTNLAGELYSKYPYDGKYLIDGQKVTICQSHADNINLYDKDRMFVINPLGYWTGGIDVDCGATNRKLGSDLGRGVTGGGIHGKDLSKADVTLNIYNHLKAQATGNDIELSCSIGDKTVAGFDYQYYVSFVKRYISSIGGFEKLAEWGLIRPEN